MAFHSLRCQAGRYLRCQYLQAQMHSGPTKLSIRWEKLLSLHGNAVGLPGRRVSNGEINSADRITCRETFLERIEKGDAEMVWYASSVGGDPVRISGSDKEQ